MSHVFRFFGEPAAGGTWRLSEDESYHLVKVLRLDVGAAVEVTDGKGTWGKGHIESVTTKAVDVALAGPVVFEPHPRIQLGFGIGALKPGAIDEILPALVELAVDEIHVFQQMDGAKVRLSDKAVDRWHRIMAQAVKQCKRSRIPTMAEHGSVYDFSVAVKGEWGTRLVLDPEAEGTLTKALTAAPVPAKGAAKILVAVGGEKGFTPTEVRLLNGAGFGAARLGPYVLRAVTAALAAASTLAMYREDQRG